MQDVFLVMDKKNAHVYCEHKEDECQLCFNYAEKIPVQAKYQTVGGNAANTAVGFARLGYNAAIYTHLGDDDSGEQMMLQLKKNKVKTDFVQIDKNKESNYNTIINTHGERTILTYHQQREYKLPKLTPADWLYFTSLGTGFESIIPDVLEYAIKNKVKIVFQPGTYQIKYGSPRVQSLLHHTKILFLNKEEVQYYFNTQENDYSILLDVMLKAGPETVVLTDGKNGAFAASGKDKYFLKVPCDQERVDTTGAGDSFATGFTSAMMDGLKLEDGLIRGQLEASSVIRQIGAQTGLLYKKDLDESKIEYNKFKVVKI